MCAAAGAAAAQTLPVPLNEIMPRLPPVPLPRQPAQSTEPCRVSPTIIPMGGTKAATRAEQTPDGIALTGGEEVASEPTESPACPVQPN